MTEGLSRWETTRLSKHFILLDFLADREVYRPYDGSQALAFDDTWNCQHEALAKGLCSRLLEPLIADEHVGPISVADAFVPSALRTKHKMRGHRWAGGEATVDIAPYKLVDDKGTDAKLRKAVLSMKAINDCCRHINSYPETEFLCVTFNPEASKCQWRHNPKKKKNLRAHHVRVGRYFNLLDFCRSGRAVEEGIDLVPKGAENNGGRDYIRVREEVAARSFAAALDPMVEQLGRISVVRGIETEVFQAKFPDAGHAKLHRWDREDGPWRLVFVLPQGANPERACSLLMNRPHVHQDVRSFRHASGSNAVALVVDRRDYDECPGLRPVYRTSSP